MTAVLITLFSIAVFACSTVAGTDYISSGDVDIAFVIFRIGILLLFLHIGLFVYRSFKKQPKSKLLFLATIGSAIFIIPIALLFLIMAAGAACGHGGIGPSLFLLILQVIALLSQVFSSKFFPTYTDSSLDLN